MIENIEQQDEEAIFSDKELSNDAYSGTVGSFFEEEDQNLIEKKELNKKENIINGSISFINKFEFMKNSNFIYKLYTNNISLILIMNIISLIFFLLIIVIKLILFFFFSSTILSNKFMLYIVALFIPFLFSTLVKIILLYKDYKNNDNESENKDLMILLIQKWNIYYSISLFLLSLSIILKFLIIYIFNYNYHYKLLLMIDLLIIILSLIILGIIYHFTKSSKNNILIIKTIDIISFPLSISVLLSFVIINFVDEFNHFIYISGIYCFLLSCLSLLLMVYYNDILFSFLVLIYQMGGIKNISFYNMNFHLFCTLINLGFIIFMCIKNLRKGFLFSNEENNYKLIDEQFKYAIEETND